ncbi:MAG: TonB-dependent receptor [Parabacteroides sp.]|nr:TonB-dependent receptor [Parabacteroides sp.]
MEINKKSWYLVKVGLILCMYLLGYENFIYAQKTSSELTISGLVFDEFEETLPGVAIYLKDRPGTGWITDDNGKFSIKAQRGDVLVFTFLGYTPLEHVVIQPESSLKITMSPQTTMLEETVVVGMGTQRKVSVVGAITSVDVAELQTPATSLTNVLGGRVPGVISMQASGEPGKNIAEFWIRGIGTFGANSGALVLIDGLEGSLSQVDPADIESFSVLKDASATAVYGVRGANGVVLITTKRGSKEKLKITIRSNIKLSYLNRMPEFLDAYDYAVLANEASVVSGNQQRYSDIELELIKYGLDPDLYPNVNWRKEILKNTSWQNTHYISARGGGSIARYFVSMGLSTESSAYKQDLSSKYKKKVGYNTYNYRMNLDIDLTKTTEIYMGLDGYIGINNLPGDMNTSKLWRAQAQLTPLTVPTRFSNGNLPVYGPDDSLSPFVLLNHTGITTNESYKNLVTVAINQDFDFIIKGLTGKIQGAFDNRNYYTESRHKQPDLYKTTGRNTNGELIMIRRLNAFDTQYSSLLQQWRKYHLEANLNYDRVFNEDHRIGGLLYYYMSSEKDTQFKTSMTAIPKKYQGISSRLTYGYKDTYMIDGNFGYTGSENFKRGEQFGFFPSIAIGWVPSQYNWMQTHIPFVSFLKIRSSYGTVGNDRIANDRFPYLTIINSNASAGWGGSSGLIESVVGADNLVWEVAKKADIGIEGKFLNNSIELVFDLFHDKRDGIFQKRTQLPTWVGAITMPYGNVGSMVSYGADGNISYMHDFKNGVSFTFRGNFTYSDNEIKNWEQPYQKYDYLSYINKPYNVLRGYKAIGLFKDELDVRNSPTQFGKVRPGDIKYKDITGDGKITEDDKVPLSYSPFPRLMYGFGGELRIKDFTLGVLFKGTGRTDFFYHNNGFGYIPFYGENIGNVLSMVNDPKNRWTPAWYSNDPSTENPNARFPRLSYGRNENNDHYSSFWLGNSRYLRLQEVTLNYNFKTTALRDRLGVSSIDMQFVGSNLAVWDKVKIWDPEQANKNGYEYPIPMTFALQMYINF